jgi:hypothetical protein
MTQGRHDRPALLQPRTPRVRVPARLACPCKSLAWTRVKEGAWATSPVAARRVQDRRRRDRMRAPGPLEAFTVALSVTSGWVAGDPRYRDPTTRLADTGRQRFGNASGDAAQSALQWAKKTRQRRAKNDTWWPSSRQAHTPASTPARFLAQSAVALLAATAGPARKDADRRLRALRRRLRRSVQGARAGCIPECLPAVPR